MQRVQSAEPNRMSDHIRARTYLEWALEVRDPDDHERGDDLAWLSRCIIQEIDT